MVLTEHQKQLILLQETLERFGYSPEDLSFGSKKKVLHRCIICSLPKETLWRLFIQNKGTAHKHCALKRVRQNNLAKYGVETTLLLPEIRKRQKQTLMRNYGVVNPSQAKEIKEKKKNTSLRRFGTAHPWQSKEVQYRQRQTCLQRYGVGNNKEKIWKDGAGNNIKEKALWCIRERLLEEGYQLRSSQYINAMMKLDIECPVGHQCKISWNDYNNCNVRCSFCNEPRHQQQLGEILERLFSGKVKHNDKPLFLEGMELDFHIHEIRLGIEYDGLQHYQPVSFGCKDIEKVQQNFKDIKRRDKRKNKLCKENKYQLIRISYKEKITFENVRNILVKRGVL